jgi:hypothetical protein
MQLKRHSLFESITNIVVGYSINFAANVLIFPIYGWTISTRQNIEIGILYTVISLARSYGLRRIFTRITE